MQYVIQYRDLNGLDTIEWPVQSPDLNVIGGPWMDMGAEMGVT